jgi:hypothetical protein
MTKISKIATACAGLLLATHVLAQQSTPNNSANGYVPLGGFPGCNVAPAQDSCDARVTCRGVGTLFGNTGADLQAATEEGEMEAKNELAKFYSDKQKAQDELSKVRKDVQNSTTDGGKVTKTSVDRMIASVSTSSTEQLLSGVQVLSRDVDAKQEAVTVEVGVSCKSQAAAAHSQAMAARSASPAGSGNAEPAPAQGDDGPQGFRTPPGQLGVFRQQAPNADNF